jgi:leucyl-tRNA synthetase
MRILLILLNPMAPHMTEELWERLGFEGRIAGVAWPTWNEAFLQESEVELVIQVNGKVRDKFVVARESSREQVEALALASPRIQDWTAGLTVKKVVVVPGKLVNLVVA